MRMGAAHLAPQGGGFEPQRAYDWEVELYGVPGQEAIKLSAQSMTLAAPESEVIPMGYLNEVIKVAGQAKWGEATLVCRDFVDQQTFSSLMQWRSMVHDPESGNTNFAAVYKKQGAIVYIAPDGSSERRYQLNGIWPSKVTPAGVDYTDGTKVYTVEVTMQCDKAIPLF
jgi:hypothetical protein